MTNPAIGYTHSSFRHSGLTLVSSFGIPVFIGPPKIRALISPSREMYRTFIPEEKSVMLAPTEGTELHRDDPAWPLEAGMVMSALEAGSWTEDRREHTRGSFRTKALLWLFAD